MKLKLIFTIGLLIALAAYLPLMAQMYPFPGPKNGANAPAVPAVINTSAYQDSTGTSFGSWSCPTVSSGSGHSWAVWVTYYDPTDAVTVNTVVDTAGDSLTGKTGRRDSAHRYQQWFTKTAITGNASDGPTVTTSSSVNYVGIYCFEVANANTVDSMLDVGLGTQSFSTTITSPTFSTEAASEIVLGAAGVSNGGCGSMPSTTPSGYTIYQDSADQHLSAYEVFSMTEMSVTLALTCNESPGNMGISVIGLHN